MKGEMNRVLSRGNAQIVHKSPYRHKPAGGSPMMVTAEEFKIWLMSFDFDNDGRISPVELCAAMNSLGVWFSFWKCRIGMKQADVNRSGYIEEHEIPNLWFFAEKYMGFWIDMTD